MAQAVLSTVENPETATSIARALVSENLAACVNIIPNMLSVYKWGGQLEEAGECLLIIKTAYDRIATLMSRLEQLHPYDVPEAICLEISQGLPAYLNWVNDETRPR